jgi:hypothetical protein
MGYSLSWAALRNGTLETICSSCSLRATGKREEIPESRIVSVEIPSRWQLVLYTRSEVDDQVLAKLSAEGEVVSCFVEDHVMFSSASGWARGKQVWKVFHDCEKGRYHLETAGAAPIVLAGIQKRLVEKQDAVGGEKADVDYIHDIPAELVKAMTGFRHDEEIQGSLGDVYHVLEPAGRVARLTSTFRGKNTVLLVFRILLVPMLPLIWTRRLVQKLRDKRFVHTMVIAGRTVEWGDIQRELSQGRGTLILQNPSFKGAWHLWWTPDALAKESPFPYATSKEKGRAGFEFEFIPFNKWCYENYTNPGSGKAMLVKSTGKALRRELEGREYIKFFRLRTTKGKNSGE